MPGLGNRPGIGDGRPGIGEGRPSQLPARDFQQRREGLQDRLASRDQIRDRQDIREDWQNRYDNIYNRHEDWHHGFWHGNASDWWHHMWDDHTALMAFGTTMWGINRVAYGFGYWNYANPYYTEPYAVGNGTVIDYSEPIQTEVQQVAAAPAEVAAPAAAPVAPPAADMTAFDAARQAFYQGDYAGALASTNQALVKLPNDPIIHEFRALVLFALGRYQEAAAGLYSVLAVGPGWDWTTLSSLYPSIDVYTRQLRALEAELRDHPDNNAARFVLAYHYLTMGSKDAAGRQLAVLYKQNPQDRLIKELLLLTSGPQAVGAEVAEKPAEGAPAVPAADVVGTWSATGAGNTRFAMELMPDGKFSWTYSHDGDTQKVQGVYALDGNLLAMEPTSGGVMLAQLAPPKDGQMDFQLLGAPPGDPGLKFAKTP